MHLLSRLCCVVCVMHAAARQQTHAHDAQTHQSDELEQEIAATNGLIAAYQRKLELLQQLRTTRHQLSHTIDADVPVSTAVAAPPAAPTHSNLGPDVRFRRQLGPAADNQRGSLAALFYASTSTDQFALGGGRRHPPAPATSAPLLSATSKRLLLRVYDSGLAVADGDSRRVPLLLRRSGHSSVVVEWTQTADSAALLPLLSTPRGSVVTAAGAGSAAVHLADSHGAVHVYDTILLYDGRVVSGLRDAAGLGCRPHEVCSASALGIPPALVGSRAGLSLALVPSCGTQLVSGEVGVSFASFPGTSATEGLLLVGTSTGRVVALTNNCSQVASLALGDDGPGSGTPEDGPTAEERQATVAEAVVGIDGSLRGDASGGADDSPTASVASRVMHPLLPSDAGSCSEVPVDASGAAGLRTGVTAMAQLQRGTMLAVAVRRSPSRGGAHIRFLSEEPLGLLPHRCSIDRSEATGAYVTSLAYDVVSYTSLWAGLSNGDVLVFNTRSRLSSSRPRGRETGGGVECVLVHWLSTPLACDEGGASGPGVGFHAEAGAPSPTASSAAAAAAPFSSAVTLQAIRGYVFAASPGRGVAVYRSSLGAGSGHEVSLVSSHCPVVVSLLDAGDTGAVGVKGSPPATPVSSIQAVFLASSAVEAGGGAGPVGHRKPPSPIGPHARMDTSLALSLVSPAGTGGAVYDVTLPEPLSPVGSLRALGAVADVLLANRSVLVVVAVMLMVAFQFWRQDSQQRQGDPDEGSFGGRGRGGGEAMHALGRFLGVFMEAATLVLARTPMGMVLRSIYLARKKKAAAEERGRGDRRGGGGARPGASEYDEVLQRLSLEEARKLRGKMGGKGGLGGSVLTGPRALVRGMRRAAAAEAGGNGRYGHGETAGGALRGLAPISSDDDEEGEGAGGTSADDIGNYRGDGAGDRGAFGARDAPEMLREAREARFATTGSASNYEQGDSSTSEEERESVEWRGQQRVVVNRRTGTERGIERAEVASDARAMPSSASDPVASWTSLLRRPATASSSSSSAASAGEQPGAGPALEDSDSDLDD